MATLGTTVTAQAWAVLESIGAVESVTYTVIPAPVRNLTGGQTTGAGQTYTVDMLIRAYRRTEIDGTAVVAGDLLARVPQSSLPIEPNTRHTVTYQGVVWSIVAVASGANQGWWRLTLRRPRAV